MSILITKPVYAFIQTKQTSQPKFYSTSIRISCYTSLDLKVFDLIIAFSLSKMVIFIFRIVNEYIIHCS